MWLCAAQVEQDGSFRIVDVSNRGGRTFLGLGTQLTGYKVCFSLVALGLLASWWPVASNYLYLCSVIIAHVLTGNS